MFTLRLSLYKALKVNIYNTLLKACLEGRRGFNGKIFLFQIQQRNLFVMIVRLQRVLPVECIAVSVYEGLCYFKRVPPSVHLPNKTNGGKPNCPLEIRAVGPRGRPIHQKKYFYLFVVACCI